MAKDDLPKNADVERELLRFLRLRQRPVEPLEVYEALADKFKLTQQQMSIKRNDTHESLWHNRVQAAREHLARPGFMHRQPYGQWSLTKKGCEYVDRAEKVGWENRRTATLDDLDF